MVVAGGGGLAPTAVGIVAVGIGAANGPHGDGGRIVGADEAAAPGNFAHFAGAVGGDLEDVCLVRLVERIIRHRVVDGEHFGFVGRPGGNGQSLPRNDGVPPHAVRRKDGVNAVGTGRALEGHARGTQRDACDREIACARRAHNAGIAVAVDAEQAPDDRQRVVRIQGAGGRVAAEIDLVGAGSGFGDRAAGGAEARARGEVEPCRGVIAPAVGEPMHGVAVGVAGERVVIEVHIGKRNLGTTRICGSNAVVGRGNEPHSYLVSGSAISGVYGCIGSHLQINRSLALLNYHPAVAPGGGRVVNVSPQAPLNYPAGAGNEPVPNRQKGIPGTGGGGNENPLHTVGEHLPAAVSIAGLSAGMEGEPNAVIGVCAGLRIARGRIVVGKGEGEGRPVTPKGGAAAPLGQSEADIHAACIAHLCRRLRAQNGEIPGARIVAGSQRNRAAAAAGRADEPEVEGLVRLGPLVIDQRHHDDDPAFAVADGGPPVVAALRKGDSVEGLGRAVIHIEPAVAAANAELEGQICGGYPRRAAIFAARVGAQINRENGRIAGPGAGNIGGPVGIQHRIGPPQLGAGGLFAQGVGAANAPALWKGGDAAQFEGAEFGPGRGIVRSRRGALHIEYGGDGRERNSGSG